MNKKIYIFSAEMETEGKVTKTALMVYGIDVREAYDRALDEVQNDFSGEERYTLTLRETR